MADPKPQKPLTIRMHERDNVAIVANDGGLPAGTMLRLGADAARTSAAGPQSGAGRPAGRRRGSALQRGNRLRAEGHSRGQLGARAAAGDAGGALAGRTADRHGQAGAAAAARGLHVRGLPERRTARSARATSWRSRRPSSAWPASPISRCSASRANCCRRFPSVDDVVALEHTYGCGVAIDAPDAIVPIRTLRNISLNPNFGGEVMVVSLGCEKLQPERLLPPGHDSDRRRAQRRRRRGQRRGCARRGMPAGRETRRLHVDDRLDHDPGRGTPRAPECAPAGDGARQRAGGGRAMRRQRRLLRRHRESGGRLLHGPAGTRGRDA